MLAEAGDLGMEVAERDGGFVVFLRVGIAVDEERGERGRDVTEDRKPIHLQQKTEHAASVAARPIFRTDRSKQHQREPQG